MRKEGIHVGCFLSSLSNPSFDMVYIFVFNLNVFFLFQFLPCSNGFLEATISALAVWRKALSDYPVVTWPIFMDHVRSKVNLLSSEEHLKELMCQLQLVGEVRS